MKLNKYIGSFFAFVAFLFSVNTAYATFFTYINNPYITSCGSQDYNFSGYFNEPEEDDNGQNRVQYRLAIYLDSVLVYTKNSQGNWSTSQSITIGSHTIKAQLQRRLSFNHGNTWTTWSDYGSASDTDNFTVQSCTVPTATPTATPVSTPTATPNQTSSPTSQPTYSPTATPVYEPTSTPSGDPTSTPTSSSEPTATPNGDICANLDGIQTSMPDDYHHDNAGVNCLKFELGGPSTPSDSGIGGGQVLGASTMAGTGATENAIFNSLFTLGSLLTSFGIMKNGKKKA